MTKNKELVKFAFAIAVKDGMKELVKNFLEKNLKLENIEINFKSVNGYTTIELCGNKYENEISLLIEDLSNAYDLNIEISEDNDGSSIDYVFNESFIEDYYKENVDAFTEDCCNLTDEAQENLLSGWSYNGSFIYKSSEDDIPIFLLVGIPS